MLPAEYLSDRFVTAARAVLNIGLQGLQAPCFTCSFAIIQCLYGMQGLQAPCRTVKSYYLTRSQGIYCIASPISKPKTMSNAPRDTVSSDI